MSATDNILAGIGGALEGFKDVFVPYTLLKTKSGLERQARAEQIQQEEQSKRRLNQQESDLGVQKESAKFGQEGYLNYDDVPQTLRSVLGMNPGDRIRKETLTPSVNLEKTQIAANKPDKQRPLTQEEIKKISSADDIIRELQSNINNLKEGKHTTGLTDPRNLNVYSRKLKSPEFQTFAADTDRTFQKFRSATTGAQASFSELAYLKDDFPSVDLDNPTTYEKKANAIINAFKDSKSQYLDNLGAAKRDVGNFSRESKSPMEKSGGLKTGFAHLTDADLQKRINALRGKR